MFRYIKYEWHTADDSGSFIDAYFKFRDGSRYLDPNSQCSNQREYFIKEGPRIYHVVVNARFPYVGADLLQRVAKGDATWRSVSNIFLQGSEQVEELLGADGETKDPLAIVKILAEYLDA